MTSANILKLPVQSFKRADNQINSEKRDNAGINSFESELKNIVQEMEQGNFSTLNASNDVDKLNPVISKFSSQTGHSSITIQESYKRVDVRSLSGTSQNGKNGIDSIKYAEKEESPSKQVNSNQNSKSIHNSEETKMSDEVVGKIRDTIKKDLNISDEQLDGALEKLGLKIEDLADPANLTLLAAELIGNGDASVLLLTNGITDLMKDVKNILEEAGLEFAPTALEETDMLQPVSDGRSGEKGIVLTVTDGREDGTHILSSDEESDEEIFLTQLSDNADEREVEDGDSSRDARFTVVDRRTDKTEVKSEELPVQDEETEDDGIPETVTSEKTGNNGQNNENTFNDNSSRFMKTPESAAKNDSVPDPAQNVNQNVSVNSFQATYTEVTQTVSYQTASYRTIDVGSVINQIVDAARVTLTDVEHTMEMVLNPHELGRIFMEVTSRDGVLRAKLFTENENVRAALQNQMQILQESFVEKGLKISSVEISVGAHEFRENQEESRTDFNFAGNNGGEKQDGQASEEGMTRTRRIDINNLDNLKGLMTEEELLTARIMKEQGNSVDYTA